VRRYKNILLITATTETLLAIIFTFFNHSYLHIVHTIVIIISFYVNIRSRPPVTKDNHNKKMLHWKTKSKGFIQLETQQTNVAEKTNIYSQVKECSHTKYENKKISSYFKTICYYW